MKTNNSCLETSYVEILEIAESIIELHLQETSCFDREFFCILKPPDISNYLSLIFKSAMCINSLFYVIEYHVRSVLSTSNKEVDNTKTIEIYQI